VFSETAAHWFGLARRTPQGDPDNLLLASVARHARVTRRMTVPAWRSRVAVYRPLSGRVVVHLPYREGNRDFLREAGPGVRPGWDVVSRHWTVSRSAFMAIVDLLREEFGLVEVITDGSSTERCDTRCREATGDDCVCSCAGSQHGLQTLTHGERVVGETTIVGTTSRWRRVVVRD
jgi:hypothetical protein